MSLNPQTYEAAKDRANRYNQKRREKLALKSLPRKSSGKDSHKPLRRSLKPASGVKTPFQRPSKRLRTKPDPKGIVWSKAVRERDGNECQWPGLTIEVLNEAWPGFSMNFSLLNAPCSTGDVRIDPHHVNPRSRRPDLKYEISNGICLCRAHHDWVGNNPREAEKIGLLRFDSYEAAQKARKENERRTIQNTTTH